MLVKHNLATREYKDVLNWAEGSSIGEYVVEHKENCIYFKATKDTTNPVLLGYFYNQYKDNYCTMIIKNIGESTLRVNPAFEKNERNENVILHPGDSIKITRKELADGISTWIYLNDLKDAKRNNGIQIMEYMITKDDFPDLYLPNINTLPEDKQPLLPPEGNYKEIQAL